MAASLDNPVWVLLPGFDGSGALFSPLLQSLPAEVETRVMAYPPDRAMDYTGLRLFIESDLPRVPYLLIAESFAGPLALQLAGKRDPWLRGVVLCASFVANPRPLLSAAIGEWIVNRFSGRALPRWFVRVLFLDGWKDEQLERATIAAVQRLSPEVLTARWRALKEVDVSVLLVDCPVPLRILHATRDRMLGDRALNVMQKIREDLDVVSIEAPHFLLQTTPMVAATAIEEFARRL